MPEQSIDARQVSERLNISELEKALDSKYRGLVDAAKADWKRLFGDGDPSDACVSIHIAGDDTNSRQARLRAGVLRTRAKSPKGEMQRRLA